MIKLSQAFLFATALATGLVAGLFYSWTISVTPGLHKLADREYVLAFQAMNKAILNPMFFISFMGSLVLLPLATWTNYGNDIPKFYLLVGATVLYFLGVFGTTVAGNVPMNESLAAFDVDSASLSQIAEQRISFESRWNFLNTIRTYCSIATLALVIIACLRDKN
ncbi:anthrone oxygenase family protein [Pseudochryseolinea flava]|uniref:DUF1772 domain-containing protein n=1 Tax=Pseudochryseolinea flava TaxID=2059302 RepID=A0A364XYM8_9BACT|nr:anthrone oxygenase family protein [Pseudochryseolinea flava]RAV98695.1 DUF1772 domain-containing protein [Pseudochryseolinea flava]